jgi:hypothetical protein
VGAASDRFTGPHILSAGRRFVSIENDFHSISSTAGVTKTHTPHAVSILSPAAMAFRMGSALYIAFSCEDE